MSSAHALHRGFVLAGVLALAPCGAVCAATYTVTRADDPVGASTCAANDCTLRAAILAANANAGPDTIAFAVPTNDANGEAVLVLDRDLPPLTDIATTIDGYTQPGAAQSDAPMPHPAFPHTIKLTLEPRGQVPYPYIGLTLAGQGHRVQGLAIRSFYYAQIDVHGRDHVIARNLIGLAAYERDPYAIEPFFGIRLRDIGADVTGNTIGGAAHDANVFAHVGTAISVVGVGDATATAAPNRIAANLLGVAPDGLRALPLVRGIEVRDAHHTRIGTDDEAPTHAGNIVAGIGPDAAIGIELTRGSHTRIDGNVVGGTAVPAALPHLLDIAMSLDPAAQLTELGANAVVAANTDAQPPGTISFARALAIDTGILGASYAILVRRTAPQSGTTGEASVDVAELTNAAQSAFVTNPPELATGATATLHWPADDTTPRIITVTFAGHGDPGPYGDSTRPRPYGTELRLALTNPQGATLGPHPATRLSLHAGADTITLRRFDPISINDFE